MANWSTIQKNWGVFKTRMANPPGTEEELLEIEEPAITVTVEQTPQRPAAQTQQPQQQTPPQQPQTPPPAQPQPQTQQQPPPKPQTQQQTQPPPVETRDRVIYFTQVDRDGQIRQTRVVRRLPNSSTPMQDSINAMLLGPNPNELNGNMLSFIPQKTKLLSATVRGSTAYLNFNEDFLFNTLGVEGYVAQLRQIVWTVTEFQNVKDVQILVEGRVMDYLGEGIWIGSPINRQSF